MKINAQHIEVSQHAIERAKQRGFLERHEYHDAAGIIRRKFLAGIPYGGKHKDGMMMLVGDFVFPATRNIRGDCVILTCLTKDYAIANMQSRLKELRTA